MACDLNPGIVLRKAMIPINIQDAVKESMSNLTIQDRLLLKRAALLGPDFDLHSLESISTGMGRSEVLQLVSNLLSNHIFSSACSLENRIEVDTPRTTVLIDNKSICFCYAVYLKRYLRDSNASEWSIGPYHRLKFRTSEFRTCILGYMTQEQIYNLRIEAVNNLESYSTECAACKDLRAVYTDSDERNEQKQRHPEDFEDCVCLIERPRIYSEISHLYSTLGMIFLPIYFKKKAAQCANKLKFPVQALCNIQRISNKMEQCWLMSEEDKLDEVSYFDPLVLDVSLKKTMAEAYLLLGDAYSAITLTHESIDMLGMNSVCLHGAYKPQELKRNLSKFKLLHAEYITKLLGVLSQAYLKTNMYEAAYNLLKIEYFVLKAFPIDFIQVLNNMATMYWYKYLVCKTKKLVELERNIFKLCSERHKNLNRLDGLYDIVVIGNTYATIVKVSFALRRFETAKHAANDAISMLEVNNYRSTIPIMRILLSHIYFYVRDYKNCSEEVLKLFKIPTATSRRKYRALSICCLAMFLTKSSTGVSETDISFMYNKCNTFASTWRKESSRVLSKEVTFYVSVVMTWWCWYSDKNTAWISDRTIFGDCYELAKKYQIIIERSKFNYWTVNGLILLLQMQIKLVKESYNDIAVDRDAICYELKYLKENVTKYPLYLEQYKELVREAEKQML